MDTFQPAVDLIERCARIRAKALMRGVLLDPPLDEAALAAFEARTHVRLPEAYRAFLRLVGDGPQTPYQGRPVTAEELVARGLSPDMVAVEIDKAEQKRCQGPPGYGLLPLAQTLLTSSGELLQPDRSFPLTNAWSWLDEAERDEDRYASTWYDGRLTLGTEGDGLDWNLIVTGPARGAIWLAAGHGAAPGCPDFLTWYEAWLDGHPGWD